MGSEIKSRPSGKAVFNGSNHCLSIRGLKNVPTVLFQANWPITNQPTNQPNEEKSNRSNKQNKRQLEGFEQVLLGEDSMDEEAALRSLSFVLG